MAGRLRTNRRRNRSVEVVGAAVLGALISALVLLIAAAPPSDAVGESSYVPMAPSRILDTRAGFQIGEHATPWQADTSRHLTVTGIVGVPATGVEAVVLNITTVSPTAAGSWLTVFPSGQPLPEAASMNFVANEVKNDVVIATVGTGGQVSIYNAAGTVDLVIDVAGYYTNSVESRLASVETLLAGLTRETVDGHDTLRLTGANLQIVNGGGNTYGSNNGTGNVIIGYNANNSDTRTGSHNLVIGGEHSYTKNGTVLFGFNNTTTADGATVTGGWDNTASANSATVSGGEGNEASGLRSTVAGGTNNTSSGLHASVSGGAANSAVGLQSSVTGGHDNTASGMDSSVTGGSNNTASGQSSAISGGGLNTTTFTRASVSGGQFNTAGGFASSVTGGEQNSAQSSYSTVSGGRERSAPSTYDWAAGDLFQDS